MMMVNRFQLIEVVLILLNEGLLHTFTDDLVHEETIHLLISDLDRQATTILETKLSSDMRKKLEIYIRQL